MTYIPTDGFVIITGASRGIGAAIAYECIERNINIAVSCVHNYSLLEDIHLPGKYGRFCRCT